MQLRLVLLGLLLNFNLSAHSPGGIEPLIPGYPYLTHPPSNLWADTNGITLIYPQGILMLSPELEVNEQTLWSLFLSSAETWPAAQQGCLQEDQLLWITNQGDFYQRSIHDKSWVPLDSPGQDFGRIIPLDVNQVLTLDNNNIWSLNSYHETWQTQELQGISPLGIFLPGQLLPGFYDPLTNQLIFQNQPVQSLSPAPGKLILQGLHCKTGYYLWNNEELWLYDIQGNLMERTILPVDYPLLARSAERGVYLYSINTSELCYKYDQGTKGFVWNQNIEKELWLNYLEPLLENPNLEKWQREFTGWALEEITKIYIHNPLNRDMAILKNMLEERLKSQSLF
jgi:hypothetical protein